MKKCRLLCPKADLVSYLNKVPLSELTVQCTLFARSWYMACPLTRGVRPRISLDIGHTSRQIFLSFMCCIMYGCFARANPCPIRFELRRRASMRLWSVSVPMSRVSPQWKRKGISRFSALHLLWNSRNSGTKSLIGRPLPSSPTRSKPTQVSPQGFT